MKLQWQIKDHDSGQVISVGKQFCVTIDSYIEKYFGKTMSGCDAETLFGSVSSSDFGNPVGIFGKEDK